MAKRVQGTEHEYTLYCRKIGSVGFDPHTLALDLLRESDLHAAGEFVKNGSRAYYDVGHFELSTCEVSNPHDLVVWEKAGEKILDWLRKVMEDRYLSDGGRIFAFKNNTSPQGVSYGSHENYCVSRSLPFPSQFVGELVPHLSTRFIYTGAGDIIDGKYVLSPMAYLTSKVVSGETMHNTGILNTRDEPHAAGYRRLHVIVGDALMNEAAILVRHFATSAVLTLMEEGALGDVPRLAQPVEDMWHNVERRNPDEWRVVLDGGKRVSPIDIQRYYLAKAEPLAETDRDRQAFRMWEDILDGLEGKDSRTLARRIEWIDRYLAIQEQAGDGAGPDVEMMACKQYSEIGAERSLFYRRQGKGLVDRVATDEEILRAIREPPEDTRAALRRRLCDTFNIESIDWSVVVVNDGTRRRLELPDPYATQLEEAYVAAG